MLPDAPRSVLDCHGDQITHKIREGNTEILNMLNIFGPSPGLGTNAQDAPRRSRINTMIRDTSIYGIRITNRNDSG